MTRHGKKYGIVAALMGMALLFTGCSDSDSPTTAKQNKFPTVQGIQISPNAPVYVDDTVTLTAVTDDPNDDDIRYTWSKNGGFFDPEAAVGSPIKWTAPSENGTYQVVVVGDDGNGGTSQKHQDIVVLGGNQNGGIDVVGGVKMNPVGGTTNVGYIDAGDTVTLTWDGLSIVVTDSTRPDETRYSPDGTRWSGIVPTTPPQYGYSEGLPSRNAARYCMIGRVGESGDWFEFTPGPDTNGDGIPDTYSAVATQRGRLYLGVNEQQELLVDNTGYWRFTFVITH